MMYGFWDMMCDGCSYFSFRGIFCLFVFLKASKIGIFKNWKKHRGRYHHQVIRWYTVSKIWCITDIISFYFLSIFAFLPPSNSLKNQNFEKMEKTPGDIIILHTCTKHYDQIMFGSWDMVRDRCNYYSFCAFFVFLPP